MLQTLYHKILFKVHLMISLSSTMDSQKAFSSLQSVTLDLRDASGLWVMHYNIDHCGAYLVMEEGNSEPSIPLASMVNQATTSLAFNKEYTYPWYTFLCYNSMSAQNTEEYWNDLLPLVCSVFNIDHICPREVRQPFFNLFRKVLFFHDAG